MPVLPDEIVVTRAFYLSCREDLRKLKRITTVWDYLRAAAESNRALLMGDGDAMAWVRNRDALNCAGVPLRAMKQRRRDSVHRRDRDRHGLRIERA